MEIFFVRLYRSPFLKRSVDICPAEVVLRRSKTCCTFPTLESMDGRRVLTVSKCQTTDERKAFRKAV